MSKFKIFTRVKFHQTLKMEIIVNDFSDAKNHATKSVHHAIESVK